MKISGRVFRTDKILANRDEKFAALYKGHILTVEKSPDGDPRANPIWSVEVKKDAEGAEAKRGTVQRCDIRSAIYWALDWAKL